MLEQNVVTHRVHEGAKALGLAHFSAVQGGKNAGERLLADVFNRLRRTQPRAQLELDQLAEIGHEMFLRPKVSRTKTFDVGLVKRLELHELAPP